MSDFVLKWAYFCLGEVELQEPVQVCQSGIVGIFVAILLSSFFMNIVRYCHKLVLQRSKTRLGFNTIVGKAVEKVRHITNNTKSEEPPDTLSLEEAPRMNNVGYCTL